MADGLSLKGTALTRLSRPDEAIAIYDEIVKRYGEDSDEELRLVVALVLWYKADMLRESDDPRAIEAFEDLVARFGDATEPEIHTHIVNALAMKGRSLQLEGPWGCSLVTQECSAGRLRQLEKLETARWS